MKKAIFIIVYLLVMLTGKRVFAYDSFEVLPGDNFWVLHKEFNVSWTDMQKINWHLLKSKDNPNLIYPHQKLLIPDGYSSKKLRAHRKIWKGAEKAASAKQAAPFMYELSNASLVRTNSTAGGISSTSLKTAKVGNTYVHEIVFFPLTEKLFDSVKRKGIGRLFTLSIMMFAVAMIFWHLSKRRKKFFVGRKKEDGSFCYGSCCGDFIFAKDGLSKLAHCALERDGCKALTNVTYQIPLKFQKEYQPLDMSEITDFRTLVVHFCRNKGGESQSDFTS